MSGVMSSSAPPASVATGSSTGASTPAPPAAQLGASQFSQFRLTKFVDSNPNPAKTTAKRKSMSGNGSAMQSPVPRPTSVPVGMEKGMSGKDTGATNNGDTTATATGANGSGNENETGTSGSSATAHRRTASAAAAKIHSGQHNGFGVLDLTPPLPATGQGKLGQHRDGRVRNPVPRKLKGKTDMRNGNFSVMHMDMSAHSGDKSSETRGEAAQRTSENTAKAAREALREKQGGGGGVKRRRVDGEGGWEPILSQASQIAALQASGPPGGSILPAPPKEIVHRTEMMTPEEVKYEQARLLTLLRSLNPLAVVDQMCTALAFFGGIPGAPPPDPGVNFPESEDANGNGALFVGWLSEIFPDAQRRQWSSTKVPEREQSVVQGKRPRGRPKGSKASKVRKDKGIKKGRKDGLANNASRSGGAEYGNDPADDDWVDIGIGDNEAMPSGGNANADGVMVIDFDGVEDTPSQAARKRRPGRPRGSRNKEKEKDADGSEIPAADIFPLSSPSQAQQNHIEGNASSAFELQQSPSQPPKRKPGRPPGSKTKPKEGALPPQSKPPKQPKSKEGQAPTRAKSVLDGSMPAGLNAEERAVLEAYRKNKALAGPEKPEDPNRKKRKSRAKSKPTLADGEGGQGGEENGEGSDTPTMLAQQLNSTLLQPTPIQSTTAVPPPPAKRQRKAKETVSTAATASRTNNNNNSAIDPSLQSSQPLSASPHLQNTQTQSQSQSQPRTTQQQPVRSMSTSHTNNNPFASPPMNTMGSSNMGNNMMSIESLMPSSSQQQGSGRTAQGLEAHYERFANQDSQSPNTYAMGGQFSQAHGQRASPAVGQGMHRENSQTQHRGGMTRSPQKSSLSGLSSTGNNNLYYSQNQAQPQQQSQRHIPTQSTGYGYSAGMSQNQQASRSNSYGIDAFGTRSSLGSSMSQLPASSSSTGQQQRGYGVQNQAQNQGYFDGGNVAGASYVDLPALETGLGGAGGYGVSGRSASYSGGGLGGGLFGTEQAGNGISESEIRERLLRGIGRR